MKPLASHSWAKESPYERFFDFIKPDADRFTILSEHIEKLGLNSVVIPIEGNSHFFIFPKGKNIKPSAGGAFPFKKQSPVILNAHYDRAPGSPGANDNSAAVFQLLKTALRLGDQRIDNWIIIFTDKEELKSGEGIQNQGSYSLAKKLRELELGGARIFNFDACGTGDTFIISSTVDYLLKKNQRPEFTQASEMISRLREKALSVTRYLRFNKVLLAPTPFSDDAGFLQGGIPVQTITMLPSAEADPFGLLLSNQPNFADTLISGLVKDEAVRKHIPATWRCLNSESDSHIRLTPEYYDRVIRFAVELCRD